MTTIPKTMHAIICHALEGYRLKNYPVPTPSHGEILLRTHSVGICASDLKCCLGAPHSGATPTAKAIAKPP